MVMLKFPLQIFQLSLTMNQFQIHTPLQLNQFIMMKWITKGPPIEWNSQPPAACFKSRSSPSRTNPVVSAIMGKLNHHAIDNGDITSDVPVESSYDSVPDPDTIQSNLLMMIN